MPAGFVGGGEITGAGIAAFPVMGVEPGSHRIGPGSRDVMPHIENRFVVADAGRHRLDRNVTLQTPGAGGC